MHELPKVDRKSANTMYQMSCRDIEQTGTNKGNRVGGGSIAMLTCVPGMGVLDLGLGAACTGDAVMIAGRSGLVCINTTALHQRYISITSCQS